MKLSERLEIWATHDLSTPIHMTKLLLDEVRNLELENEDLKQRLNFIHDKALSMDLALVQMEQVLLQLSTGG